jgi:MFS transporter, DHA2 family, multidrug resistance protein
MLSIDKQSSDKMSLRGWAAVLGGALGAFMAILDIQVTNASIREISGALNLEITESGWISTAYLIAEIIVIPLTGYLSEVFGLRRYIVLNCIGFLIASVLCGLSWNIESMILFRALQGFTGGTLIPLSFQLILMLMPEKQKPLGLTLFGLTVTLAPTLGPTLGGHLTDEFGWRFIFFINLVPGLLMLSAMRWGLPDARMNIKKLKDFDLFSIFTLILGLGTLTYFLEEGSKEEWFESQSMQICFIIVIVCIPLFLARQLTIEKPLLKLKLLADRNFALGTLITTLAGCALFSGIYGLSLYLGQVQDYSAAQIGKVLMWVGLPQLAIMPFMPWLMKHVDLRVLAGIGIIVFAWSNLLNSGLNLNYGGEQFEFSLIIRALGQPMFVIPLSVMAMAAIKKEDSGDASSIFNVMRNLGASIGIAMTSTMLVERQKYHLARFAEAISPYDFHIMEFLFQTENKFKSLGVPASTARAQAAHELMKSPIRDSIIQSFSDIFYVVTFMLVVCVIAILFMKKVKPPADTSAGSGH